MGIGPRASCTLASSLFLSYSPSLLLTFLVWKQGLTKMPMLLLNCLFSCLGLLSSSGGRPVTPGQVETLTLSDVSC